MHMTRTLHDAHAIYWSTHTDVRVYYKYKICHKYLIFVLTHYIISKQHDDCPPLAPLHAHLSVLYTYWIGCLGIYATQD